MSHPGYRWVVSPTRDWSAPADDAFHWAAYASDGTRRAGFAPTAAEAHRAAERAL